MWNTMYRCNLNQLQLAWCHQYKLVKHHQTKIHTVIYCFRKVFRNIYFLKVLYESIMDDHEKDFLDVTDIEIKVIIKPKNN